ADGGAGRPGRVRGDRARRARHGVVIRAVISDLGGVLTTPLIQSFLAYQEECGVRFEDLGQAMMSIAERDGEHPLFELEKGHITEAECHAAIEAELDEEVKLDSLRETYFAHLHP